MTTSHRGTVAQLVYAHKHQLDFAGIVGDLHALLVRFAGPDLIFDWDCNDIAVCDLPLTRIALGWDVHPGKGYSACLTVSVGARGPQLSTLDSNHHEMCSRLVERLHQQFPALAILWHQTDEDLTADLIDRLVDGLPPAMQLFPFEEPQWMADALQRQVAHSPVAKQARKALASLAVRAMRKTVRLAKKMVSDLARMRSQMHPQ